MGTQFARIESYGAGVRKGSKNPSADGVIGEALREDGKCDHVERPQKPNFAFGTEADLLWVREEVFRLARDGKTEVTRSDGRKELRKLANDAPTLTAAVFSYPSRSIPLQTEWKAYAQILREAKRQGRNPPPPPKSWVAFENWKKKVVKFMQEKYGDKFKAALYHMDEEHIHIHAYAVANQRPDGVVVLTGMHDGRDAKEEARREVVPGETKRRLRHAK